MKIDIHDNNTTIYINKVFIDFDIKEKTELERFIMNIVLKLKKKKNNKLSGFYKAFVYSNNNYGIIIDLIKQDDLDLFPELIDLKLIIFYDSEIYLKTNDYFKVKDLNKYYKYSNNYYINISEINNNELLNLIEFSKIIYGNESYNLKEKLNIKNINI